MNWSGFFREKEPIGYKCAHTEIYYEKMTHTVTEADKPHNLPSASWRARSVSQ